MASRSVLEDVPKTASLALLALFLTQSKAESHIPWQANANLCRSSFPGQMKARTALHKDIVHASDDSSADEEVDHPSTAPAPDAEVAYSFDAHRGPSHGSQILNVALEKAIERYEIRETDKLIKNEYEVLDADGEPLTPPKKRNIAPEDADYEFVDA
jgi:hypothetical protein